MQRIALIVWALAGCTAAGSPNSEARSPDIEALQRELPDRERCPTTQPIGRSNEFMRGYGCAWVPPTEH